MAKYEMRGGGTISGDNAREVVEAIRASSFNPEADTEAFVRALAEPMTDRRSVRIPSTTQWLTF